MYSAVGLLANKLVPCAWLSSGALEVWSLRLWWWRYYYYLILSLYWNNMWLIHNSLDSISCVHLKLKRVWPCIVYDFISKHIDYCNCLLFGVKKRLIEEGQRMRNAATARLITIWRTEIRSHYSCVQQSALATHNLFYQSLVHKTLVANTKQAKNTTTTSRKAQSLAAFERKHTSKVWRRHCSPVNRPTHWRQSGLKSGGRGSGSKFFDFFRHLFRHLFVDSDASRTLINSPDLDPDINYYNERPVDCSYATCMWRPKTACTTKQQSPFLTAY